MIRVGYIAGEPTPWRAPHLDLIAMHPDIDLSVIYAAATIQRREWNLDLHHHPVILRGPSLPTTRILHHDYPLTPQIWGLLGREKFDVLVIGGWSLLATQMAIAWARLHSVPYLLISENHLGETRPLWVKALKSLVLRYVIPQAKGLLVTGAAGRIHALHYGAPADGITIFPNTVDVAGYRRSAQRLRVRRPEIREKLSIAEEALVVMQVGRLLPEKGINETLEAVARAGALTSRRLHLLLVGSGAIQPALQLRAAELGLEITFAGFRQGEALLECYAAADLFMLLSHRETWGIVVNEAASFGLPLILTDAVGASADLLRPGENGELVSVGDVEGQARAIAKLSDERLRKQYGRRSLELVEPWGYEPSVETFVAAIRASVSDARGRHDP